MIKSPELGLNSSVYFLVTTPGTGRLIESTQLCEPSEVVCTLQSLAFVESQLVSISLWKWPHISSEIINLILRKRIDIIK